MGVQVNLDPGQAGVLAVLPGMDGQFDGSALAAIVAPSFGLGLSKDLPEFACETSGRIPCAPAPTNGRADAQGTAALLDGCCLSV